MTLAGQGWAGFWLQCEGWVPHLLGNLSLQLGDRSQLPPLITPPLLSPTQKHLPHSTCISTYRAGCVLMCGPQSRKLYTLS